MSNELVLHRGARVVSREQLEVVECPQPTDTWKPVKHSVVLNAVEETLESTGFVIEDSWLSLSKDDNRFFGVLHLGTSLADGVNLSVGLRSSTDKSFPLGFVAGQKVFVCDNLSFSSEIVVARTNAADARRYVRQEWRANRLERRLVP